MRTRFARILILILLLALCGTSISGKVVQDDDVIATVEGTPLLYKTVKTDFDKAMRLFEVKEQRKPETEEDFGKVLNTYWMDVENRRFLGAIKEIIRQKILKQHNIEVTEQEMKAEWQLQLGGMSEQERDQTAERAMRIYSRLIPALKEVHEQKQDKDAVYQKYFKGHEEEMSAREWRLALSEINTAEKIKGLEMLQDAVKNKERQIESFRRVLENRKLNALIDRELAKTDPQVAVYLKKHADDVARDPLLADLAPFTIQKKRRLWWREQHRKATVQIPTEGDLHGKATWQNYLDSPVR